MNDLEERRVSERVDWVKSAAKAANRLKRLDASGWLWKAELRVVLTLDEQLSVANATVCN